MTLNIMVVRQCFLFPLLHLLLSPHSISGSSDSHTCSPVGPSQQLENQHLSFLGLNKAVVYICQAAHMDVLIFYVFMECVWRLFQEVWGLVFLVTIHFTRLVVSCQFPGKKNLNWYASQRKFQNIYFTFLKRELQKQLRKGYSGSVGGRVLQAVDDIPRKFLKIQLITNNIVTNRDPL